MNNKRIVFYFISLLVLLSLYSVLVFSTANSPSDKTQGLYRTVIANVTDQRSEPNASTALRLNITTGENLNVTCLAERANNGTSTQGTYAKIVNMSLYHANFTAGSINLTRQATFNTSNNTILLTNLSSNASGVQGATYLQVRFKLTNGTISFNSNGGWTGSTINANEGNFSIACAAATNNTGTANYSSNLTITIDRTRPNFTTEINVSDGENVVTLTKLNQSLSTTTEAFLKNNSNLTITVSVREPHIDSVRMYWTINGTPVSLNNHLRASNPRNLTMNMIHANTDNDINQTIWNGSFVFGGNSSTSLLSTHAEGTRINFMIVANDSAGNIVNLSNGGAGFNITLDGQAPDVAFSIDKTRIETQTSIKGTCSANDTSPFGFKLKLTKPNGGTVEKTPLDGIATFKATDTGQAGTYTMECEVTDTVNFKTKKSLEFSAYYEGEASVSVEEEAEEKKVAEVDLSRSVEGQAPEGTFRGLQGESKTFTLDGETAHTLTFLQVTSTSATIRLQSTPVDITLSLGETKEVDLDGDGDNDVIVTLVSTADEEAIVTIKPTKVPPARVEETPTTTTPTETEKPSRAGVIVVVLLILAVVVAAYFLLKGKGKKKKGEIRFTSKDLSSEFKF